MNALALTFAVGALGLLAGPAMAQPAPMQPPMNDFDQAFYRCDGGEAFMMTYDSEQPQKAELISNSDNRHYELKRTQPANGVGFAAGPAKFWTDGKTATVETPKGAYKNCKTKTN